MAGRIPAFFGLPFYISMGKQRRTDLKVNTIINIVGSVLPLGISVVTIPIYLSVVGSSRYGVLSLVWLFVGYFSLLDFGVSRATVNLISKTDFEDVTAQQRILFSALWMNLAVGTAGMVLAAPVAYHFFHVLPFNDMHIRQELFDSIPWLCLTIPLTLGSAVGVGGLEARGRFDLVNIIQILGTLLTQGLPVIVAQQIGVQLNGLILTIVLCRILMFVVLLITLKVAFPLRAWRGWDMAYVRQLIHYGSRASLSGVISPVLEALDRFLIGAKLTAGDVAAYAIPFSIADKLRILPRSLARASFPRLSSLSDAEARRLYTRLLQATLCVMTPLVLIAILGSKNLLDLWLGENSSPDSKVVAVILLGGAWFNALAVVPFVYLQARGRPGVAARIHAIEFIPFVCALYVLIDSFGIVGAALAWSGRMVVDTFAFLWVAGAELRTYLWLAGSVLLLSLGGLWGSTHDISWTVFLGLTIIILLSSFLPARHFLKLKNE